MPHILLKNALNINEGPYEITFETIKKFLMKKNIKKKAKKHEMYFHKPPLSTAIMILRIEK